MSEDNLQNENESTNEVSRYLTDEEPVILEMGVSVRLRREIILVRFRSCTGSRCE